MRCDAPSGVALADIDHFKSNNDSHGRGVGDEVLVRVADSLRAAISIGVAQRQPGDDKARLLQRADLALYAAKHAGRNRVAAR